MATRIRAFDWSTTPLGPIADWPQSLRTTVDNMLGSGQAMMLAWGPENTILYNDAYAPMMGDWHPAGFARPLRDAWPDVWDDIAPLVNQVFRGETVWFENMPLTTTRHGKPKQSWWTFSYSPVRNDAGEIAGLLNVPVDTTARLRAEAALRESEEQYRLLFDGMDDGFCVIEVLFDENDRPFDYVFLKVNPSFERQTGLHDPIGRTMLSMAPQHEPFWIETYGRIARTGHSEQFDNRADALGRWYEVNASPIGEPGQNQVAVVFRDVLQRRKAEEALRESEKRHAFLVRFSDAVRGMADPAAVAATACGMLLEQMNVDRAHWSEIDWANEEFVTIGTVHSPDVLPIEGRFPLSAWEPYAALHHAGRPVVVDDTQNDLRADSAMRAAAASMEIGADLGVPVLLGDRLASVLAVKRRQPHRWAIEEIALVESVAGRCWAEVVRARAEAAMRDSEEQQAFLLKISDAVRPLADPAEIQGKITRLLLAQLNAGWCYYVDWDLDGRLGLVLRDAARDGLPSLAGEHDVSDAPEFLQLLAAGTIVKVSDYAGYEQLPARIRENFTQLGFRSMMMAPLVKGGRLIATLLVGDTEVRNWSSSEASLLGAVAERTWAVIERGRAEAALRESEVRLAQLADAAPVLIWETTEEGATFVNSHYLAYFGASFEDIAGFRWEQFIHPDDLDGYVSTYQQAFDERRAYDHECRLLRSDGQYRWHRTSGRPSTNGRFVGSCADIHALKEVEQALRLREEQQRLTIELVPALLWSASPDGREVSLNEGWLKYTGQNEAQTQNYGWLDAIYPDDLAATQAAFEYAFATGESLERQQRIRKVDNSYRWHLLRHVPVRNEHGVITRWFGAAVDIHDSKIAEQALQETELRLQTLVEGVPQLVWRASNPGFWTWASPQWTAFTGQTNEDSHGWGWLEPVHPDDRGSVRQIWAGATERGEFHADYRLFQQKEERYRWFQTRATPVRDDAGRIIEWLGTSTDVDDLRGLQERQQVLVAELQHRTRNLMGVVRSTANRTGETSKDFADFKDRFRDRLEALARVQGLLSRLNETDRIAFDELIQTEIAAMHGSADRVTLDGPSGVRLRSSMVQTLAMALHELATNAVKYGALGQSDGHLAIRWRMVEPDPRGRPRLHIEWRESGVKMPSPGSSPQGGGQGRELIEQALPYQLSAETSFRLGPDGVHCTITVPVSASRATENPDD